MQRPECGSLPGRAIPWRLASVLLAALGSVLPAQATAQAQLEVMAGPGYAIWSGPFAEGGKVGIGAVGLAADWRRSDRFSIRAELGAGTDGADLGRSAVFGEQRSLRFGRLGAGALGRYFLSAPAAPRRLFIEAGGWAWLRLSCSVRLVGGASYPTGESVDCADWSPQSDVSDLPLDPAVAGGSLTLGVGVTSGRLAALLRSEVVGTARLDTPDGAMRAHPLVLIVSWTIAGRKR
jgi:hypothetical protein